MKVLAVEEPDPDLPTHPDHNRPAGVHISDIIKQMLIERDAKKYGDTSPPDPDTLERGYVWEEVLSDALLRRNGGGLGFRPDPIEYDGVWMSPDWYNPESDFPLEEWKATRVSKKSDITDRHWYWFIQILCYLKGLGCHRARLRVWYINGDYSEAARRDPKVLQNYVRYSLEFPQREIDENWRRLMSFAKKKRMFDAAPDWAAALEEAKCRVNTGKKTETAAAPPPSPPPTNQRLPLRVSPKKDASPAPESLQRGRVLTFPTGKASKKTSKGS